jgi:AmpE protein
MSLVPLRSMHWVERWHRWLAQVTKLRHWIGATMVLVSIGLPVAATAALFNRLWNDSHFLSLIGGVVVLLFCFGPKDLGREIKLYTRSDPVDSETSSADSFLDEIGGDGGHADALYWRAVAVEAHERIFAPALWFAILGPAGAVLYRVTSVLNEALATTSEGHLARRGHDILRWLPVRLLGLGFGVAGSMTPVLSVLTRHFYRLSDPSVLVGDMAIASFEKKKSVGLGSREQRIASIDAVATLIKRTFIVWLSILGLLWASGIV